VAWAEPTGGLYVWARLPKTVRSGPQSTLFKTALDRGVFYVPGRLCYAPDPGRPVPDHELRLSFGGATEEGIHGGIERLGAALRAQRALR
jgi:DNA-binding transcriptional MocR family regulator